MFFYQILLRKPALLIAALVSIFFIFHWIFAPNRMDADTSDYISKEDHADEERSPVFAEALEANILDFFEKPAQDGLLIRWKHAVNSHERLESALADESIDMLECDVILSQDNVPICAHPPQTKSDLTVKSLLKTIVFKKVKKGLKLDFKQPEAVPATLAIISSQRFRNSLSIPLWFNADILGGPGGLITPIIGARTFIEQCLSNFRWATLSLGWTTGDGSRSDSSKVLHYTPTMVREMLDVLNEFGVANSVTINDQTNQLHNAASSHDHNQGANSQSTNVTSKSKSTENQGETQQESGTNVRVTFPVNALLLTGSLSSLYDLVQSVPNSFSLTVWSPFGDDLKRVPSHVLHDTRTALHQLRTVFDPRLVFYDLDPLLEAALKEEKIDGHDSKRKHKPHTEHLHPNADVDTNTDTSSANKG